jgi:hypothetical protein
MRIVSFGMLLGLGLGGAALAKRAPEWPKLGVETSLIFPDRTVRIADPDGDAGLWLMDRQQRWYYAKFPEPCEGLTSVGSIGYYMRGPSHLRRTSSILVDGRKCRIESLVTAAKPLPRKEREIVRQAAAEGTQTP